MTSATTCCPQVAAAETTLLAFRSSSALQLQSGYARWPAEEGDRVVAADALAADLAVGLRACVDSLRDAGLRSITLSMTNTPGDDGAFAIELRMSTSFR